MKIGITFGCFIPLHKGHMAMISRSRCHNDITIIGVCGYDDDRGHDFIPFETRYNLIKKIYQNASDVVVVKIDDKKLNLDGTFTLENWRLWCDELFTNAKINPDNMSNTYTWYSGEAAYFEKLRLLYPLHEFYLLNRGDIGISGTMIRKNVNYYKSVIHPVFREYLIKESDKL